MCQGLIASCDRLSRSSPEASCTLSEAPPYSGMHTPFTALIVSPASVGTRENFLCCLILSKTGRYADFLYVVSGWSFHWLDPAGLDRQLRGILVCLSDSATVKNSAIRKAAELIDAEQAHIPHTIHTRLWGF